MSEKKKYANVGGQAVMEGIMMRSPIRNVLAVRLPDGTISTEDFVVSDFTKKHSWARIPVVRGVVSFISGLAVGYKAIMSSAEYMIDEPSESEDGETKKEESESGWVLALSLVLGIAIAFGLFFFLPTLLCQGIEALVGAPLGGWKSVVIGLIKVLIMFGYIFAVSRMKDIKRVFQYHGAEHKTIFCFEHRKELTVENVRTESRLHPRCGTSFLLITVLVSLLFYSFVSLIPVFAEMQDSAPYLYMIIKLVFLPVLAGLSFEVLKFTGRHDNTFTRILSAPGKAFQLLTTNEPDDGQIEVAIEALKASLTDPATGELNEDAAYL